MVNLLEVESDTRSAFCTSIVPGTVSEIIVVCVTYSIPYLAETGFTIRSFSKGSEFLFGGFLYLFSIILLLSQALQDLRSKLLR